MLRAGCTGDTSTKKFEAFLGPTVDVHGLRPDYSGSPLLVFACNKSASSFRTILSFSVSGLAGPVQWHFDV